MILLSLTFLLACKSAPDTGDTDTDTSSADTDTDGSDTDTDSTDTDTGGPDTDTDTDDTDTDSGCVPTDEVCNGVDDDCDGKVDEDAIDALTFYDDDDHDGYGDPAGAFLSCELPDAPTIAGDCDDTDATINPDAVETCDGVDQDCDGVIDDGATDVKAWYVDADGDGYGDPSTGTVTCTGPSGTVDVGDDCDDADGTISPAAAEVCGNGVDENCDGTDACFPTGAHLTTDADASWDGSKDQYLGKNLSPAGDVDGDGIDDLLGHVLGASSSSHASVSGQLFFFYGDSWSGAYASSVLPERSYSTCLDDAEGVGDLDHDGYADIAVGTDCTSYVGAIHVIYGGPTRLTGTDLLTEDATIDGSSGTSYLGTAVAKAGDVDGDGFDDLLFTDYTNAYLAYGDGTRMTGSNALSSYAKWSGGSYAEPGADGEGIAAGDVDGDGLSDLLVTDYYSRASGGNIPGEVHLQYGSGTRFTGTSTLSGMDASFVGPTAGGWVWMGQVTQSGDMDGDGYDDVVASSAWASSYLGEVWVFSGSATRYSGDVADTSAAWTITGSTAYYDFGKSVAVVPDWDGGGGDDLMVGNAYQGAFLFVGEGRSGAYADTDAQATLTSTSTAAALGTSVAATDLDGDGVVDFLVGAPADATSEGMVYLWSGASF